MPRSRQPASQPSTLIFSAALCASVLAHALLLLDLPAPNWSGGALSSDPRPIIVNLQRVAPSQPPQRALRFAEQDSDGGGNTQQANQHSTSIPQLEATDASPNPQASAESNVQLLTRNDPTRPPLEQPPPSPQAQPNPAELQSVELPPQPTPPITLGDPAERQHDNETGPRKAIYGRSAKGVEWARYALDWQQKMERFGTYYFPEQLRQLQLYGGPVLTVEINADGSLATVRIARSSGTAQLDEAAQKIVRMAAPFAPFPPVLAGKYRSWEITRHWVFTDDNRLSSQSATH